VKAAGDVAAAKTGANMAIYPSTSTAWAHPLPRQLLQSNIWAHSQLCSAQIARTKKTTRKNSWAGAWITFGWLDFERRFGKVADLPDPICVDKREIAQFDLPRERIENQKEDEDAVEKKDEDWTHDCTIDVISARLDSCMYYDTLT
jgi:hypothetical protein